MNSQIPPLPPVGLNPASKSQDRKTAQGDDVRVAPVRETSDTPTDNDREHKIDLGEDKSLEALKLDVRLSIDHNATINSFVYRFVDESTGEQVRQWPREDMIKLAEYFQQLDGSLLDKKV